MHTIPGAYKTKTTISLLLRFAERKAPSNNTPGRTDIPNFTIIYKPDFRQVIAYSSSKSIDNSFARHYWCWKPEFDLAKMCKDMIENIRKAGV